MAGHGEAGHGHVPLHLMACGWWMVPCSGTRHATDRAMRRAATCSTRKLYVSAIWQACCAEQAEPHSALARTAAGARGTCTRGTGGGLVGAAHRSVLVGARGHGVLVPVGRKMVAPLQRTSTSP